MSATSAKNQSVPPRVVSIQLENGQYTVRPQKLVSPPSSNYVESQIDEIKKFATIRTDDERRAQALEEARLAEQMLREEVRIAELHAREELRLAEQKAREEAQLAQIKEESENLTQMREEFNEYIKEQRQKLQKDRTQFINMFQEDQEENMELQEKTDSDLQAKDESTSLSEIEEAIPTSLQPTMPEPLPIDKPKFHITNRGYNMQQVDAYIDNLRASGMRQVQVSEQMFKLYITEIETLGHMGGSIPIKQPEDGSISWEQISWLISQAYSDVTRNSAPIPVVESTTVQESTLTQIPTLTPVPTSAPASPAKRRVKAWSIINGILFYGFLAALVFAAYIFGTSDPTGPPQDIFGFSLMTVLTRSMQDEIPQDSLIITRRVDPNTIQIGDDITYLRPNNTTITHRVVDIRPNYQNSGQPGFQMQGTMNAEPDAEIVGAANVVGLVIFHSLFFGNVILFIRANLMLIGIFTVLTIALIIVLRRLIFNKSKEQSETAITERDKGKNKQQRKKQTA
ncbi:MAG: signal peptidase I [Oscillospiraceae bacterium]|nr:signal peptidase I [Oscillospiraceae bacterium]